MTKHVILMHGRAIKPAKKELEQLARASIEEGLRRSGHSTHADDFKKRKIKFSSAYFGDITNKILVERKPETLKKLKSKDPDFGNAPCFDAKELYRAFDLTRARGKFTASEYKKVLREAKDWRFLDEASDFVSLLGALFSAGLLNQTMIKAATADLYAYLTEHQVASDIRERLNSILYPAIMAGHDICLMTHSMGCMVAYDVLWKYAHMSEYSQLRAKGNRVSLWITFGNPLGELGVAQNLMDGRFFNERDKYPRDQINTWQNVYAEDDFVAHVERIAPTYRHLVPKDLGSIADKKIYNCWTYEDIATKKLTSNPHDLYGYLMNHELADFLGKWL